MPQLDVRVLGPVEVVRAGCPVALSPKERDLVALLACRWPEPVAADRIEEELWDGAPPATAHKVVQKYVSQLRASFGADHISSRRGRYALHDVTVDAVAFTRAVEDEDDPAADAGRTAAVLAGALGLWRGDAYEDVELVALEPQQARLAELRMLVRERQVEAELALGRHASLIGRLELLVAEHPLRERLWSQLIRALYGAGRPSDALRAYRRLRTTLGEELGVAPSPQLQDLELRVLQHDPTLAAAVPRLRAVERRVMTVVAIAVDCVDGADDPEDSARASNEQLGAVRRICAEYEGIVETASGGRIVIGFGVPARGDDADRAVRAAQQVVSVLRGARVGIATGWALVHPDGLPGTRVLGAVVDAAWTRVESGSAGHVVIDSATNLARAAPAPHLPYVGRAAELTVLHDVMTHVMAGNGPQLVTIVGEAGVGKTRLVAELRRRSGAAARWLTADCVAGAGLIGPLRAFASDRLLDDVVSDRDDREWLRTIVAGSAVVEPTEVGAACKTMLGALASSGPTVLVFEDVHRAEPGFERVLAGCLEQFHDVPLLAVTVARPTVAPTVGRGRSMALGTLTPDDIDVLLRHLVPAEAVTAVQRRALVDRSAGNPLYAIQFARMVEQHGWDGAVPASVRSLIAARLDLLDPLAADLLVAAAVIGPSFAPSELAAMLDLDVAATTGALRALLMAGLVDRASGERLRIGHDLIQEVAYERLPRSARARLHQAAAAAIERRSPGNLSAEAMRISQHLAAAARAVEDESGDARGLRRRAFDLMILAGDSLGDSPADDLGEPSADRADLDRVRAEILCRQGELGKALVIAQAGLEAAGRAGDRSARARLYALIGNIHWLRGDTTASVAALESALAVVHELEPGRAMLDALSNLAFVTALLGRTDEAIELAEQGLQLTKDHNAVDKEVRCLNARGAAKLLQGDLAGYDDFTTALARALESGLSHESAMAYHNLAELHWQGESPAVGLQLNGKGLELAERRGLVVATDWLRANRVTMCFDSGDWDEALALVDVVLSQEQAAGEGQAGTMSAVWAARIHVWRGDLERASRLHRFFLPRARRHAVIQQLGPALVVAGLIETATGRTGRGADLAQEFCRLTEQTREYRHMELADTVRLLVADGRLDAAVQAADSRVLGTVRHDCQSATAASTIASATGAPDATIKFEHAALAWRGFGHPLEEHLAWRGAGSAQSETAGDALRLDPESTLADVVIARSRPLVPER